MKALDLSREQVVTFALEEVDVDRVLVLFAAEVYMTCELYVLNFYNETFLSTGVVCRCLMFL